jgi:hypothetical protein
MRFRLAKGSSFDLRVLGFLGGSKSLTRKETCSCWIICSLDRSQQLQKQFAPDSQSDADICADKNEPSGYNQFAFHEGAMRSSSNAMLNWAVLKSGL